MVEFIMYHYVRDLKNSKFPKIKGLDYSDFLRQIKFLKKEYNIISIEEFIRLEYKLDKKTCVLTFDDGYSDHYDFVYPTLLKENIKGAFFTPVNTIINNILLDVNLIHIILASADEEKILERIIYHYNGLGESVNLKKTISTINTNSRYDSKVTIIIKRLLQYLLPEDIRAIICRLLLGDFVEQDEKEISKTFYMSKENINEMIFDGMHFGSHGKSHFWFSALDEIKQEDEIKSSIEFLDSLYNRKFDLTMCYPYGDYNITTLKLLSKYGFKLGLTTIPRSFNCEIDNLLEIPRWDTNDYYPKK
jgi:peptidoglycan/xylan/chitin deacetylase (PgdA/CDA1 family)